MDQAASARQKIYGNTAHAVKRQIWITVSVYVLAAIVKKRFGMEVPLYTLKLQVFPPALFEKTLIQQAFPGSGYKSEWDEYCSQMNLFAF